MISKKDSQRILAHLQKARNIIDEYERKHPNESDITMDSECAEKILNGLLSTIEYVVNSTLF